MTATLADISNLAGAPANGPLTTLVLAAALVLAIPLVVAYMVFMERKVAAWIQDRYGPNRCGPWGLLQTIADVVKMLAKEDVVPRRAEKWLFVLAPLWSAAPALAAVAVLPLGGTIVVAGERIDLQVARVDVGALYIIALGSLGVYGVVVGGWASNSKYSFLGGLRSAAQLLSYEVPLTLALLSVVLAGGGTLRLEQIVIDQSGAWAGLLPRWNLFTQPLTFLIFLTCVLAETNRIPFDVAEAEQELVGGYHTEYSSMKFGLFFMAEYSHLLIASALTVVLFLGGWSFWGLSAGQSAWYFGLLRLAVFAGKIFIVLWVIMQIRWTLPRFRFDQLMRLAWTGLVPAAMALLLVNGFLRWRGAAPVAYTLGNLAVFVLMAIATALNGKPVTGRQRLLQRLDESEAQA